MDYRDEIFMNIAWELSKLSPCMRMGVGALIVMEHRIVSTGINGLPGMTKRSPFKCDCHSLEKPCGLTTHAEDNAISYAESVLGKTRLFGTKMIITHSPCLNCAMKILNSRIPEVIFDIEYRDPAPIKLLLENGTIISQIIRQHKG